jgi:hypothetical protein
MPRTTFLYHAEAVGVSGHISLPVVDTVPLQASIASPLGAGSGKVRVENFKHLDYLRIDSIESHVVSSYSEKDGAYGTLATVAIEGLNNLNVVTCDRMVNRLTSKHKLISKEKDKMYGTEAGSFLLHGTHFDGLRIAGHDIKIELAIGLFSELSTWKALNDAYENNAEIRKELDALSLHPKKGDDKKLPLHNGVFGCTLATISDLPRGMERRDHGIYVPHFGTIYLAEYYISETTRRLRMLHVDLGCSVEGCNGYGDTGGGGTPMPGSS